MKRRSKAAESLQELGHKVEDSRVKKQKKKKPSKHQLFLEALDSIEDDYERMAIGDEQDI